MNATDLVFTLNENNIISAGFNINSQLLKNQLNSNINLDNNKYILPVGLLYTSQSREKYNPVDEEINVIPSDIYDQLVNFAIKPIKKSKTQHNRAKIHKKNKTKRLN